MRSLFVLTAVIALAAAKPSGIAAPHLVYSAPAVVSAVSPGVVAAAAPTIVAAVPAVVSAKVAAAPVAVGVVGALSSQYHAQDVLGQYSFGYASPLSSKAETKTFDGITRGGYTYLDAEGKVQAVSYTSDAVNGFRVAATNLPVAPPAGVAINILDSPAVAAAKAAHFAAHQEAKALVASANAIEAAEKAALVAAAPKVVATVSSAPAVVASTVVTAAAPAAAPADTAALAVEAKAASTDAADTKAAPEASATAGEGSASAAVKISDAQAGEIAAPALATVKVAAPVLGSTSYSYTTVTAQHPAIIAAAPAIAVPSAISTYKAVAAPALIAAPVIVGAPISTPVAEVVVETKAAPAALAKVVAAAPAAITATGLPADTPEVAQAKAAHLAAFEAIKLKNSW